MVANKNDHPSFDAGKKCHKVLPGVLADEGNPMKAWFRLPSRIKDHIIINSPSSWLQAKESFIQDLNQRSLVGIAASVSETSCSGE